MPVRRRSVGVARGRFGAPTVLVRSRNPWSCLVRGTAAPVLTSPDLVTSRSPVRTPNRRGHPCVKLDGHGLWAEAGSVTPFYLEWDSGTEFSGGRCPYRSPDLRVSAVQRLIRRRYRPRQVWCKQPGGVSPLPVTGNGRTTVHAEHGSGCISQAGHDSSAAGGQSQLPGREVLSRTFGGPATESATLRAWRPSRGAAWGRCERRCRDRHPDRPPPSGWAAAHGRLGCHAALLRKTLRGLSCGGGNHA
jgi:hypothetical protein